MGGTLGALLAVPASLTDAAPLCARSCWDAISHGATCPNDPAQFSSCFCTSIPLQANFSTCAQQKCVFSDQIQLRNTTMSLCRGFPQPSRKRELILLIIVGLALGCLIIGMRCWARLVSVRKLWWDDWTAVATLVIVLVSGSFGIAGTTMGFGLHVWDTDPKHTATIHQIFWVLEIAYLLSITLMKASVVLLMGRVFETPGWRKLTRYSLIILAAKVVAFLFPLVFQCAPVRAVWDPDVEGKCLSLPAMTMVGAGLSISEDLVLMALPVPTLLKLPLDKSRQMLLIGLFGVGSFACVTSFVRIKPLLKFSDTDDLTWDYVDVVVWTGIEVVAALVCGSLPPCRQLIMRFCSYVSSLVANSSSRRREDIIVEVVEVTSGNSKLLQSQSNVRKESTATTDTGSACAC